MVNLSSAKVGGCLDFQEAEIHDSLDLRGCAVEFFLDNKTWPLTYYINGFSYRRLEHKIAIRKIQWFKNWLGNQAEFSPKSYELLSQSLKDDGYKAKADGIEFSGKQRQLRHTNWGSWREWPQGLLLLLQLLFVGYGYKMYFSLFWVIGLTGIETLYLQYSCIPKGISLNRFWEKLFFTLDTLLPIIELDSEYKKIMSYLPQPIRYSFFLIEILGWFIGSFLVVSLSGLTKKIGFFLHPNVSIMRGKMSEEGRLLQKSKRL